MKRLVLDASVILKWYLLDEAQGDQALQLLQQCATGQLEILAPSLLPYELMNGLMIAGRRARIHNDAVVQCFRSFLNLGVKLHDPALFADKVFQYAQLYNRSVYDASYLALAEQEGVDFMTADERLINSVKTQLHWVRRIGDVR